MRWVFSIYAHVAEAAKFFDIPPLRDAAIKGCVASLQDKMGYELLDDNGKFNYYFASGLEKLFKEYSEDKEEIEPILSALCEAGFAGKILASDADSELGRRIREQPELKESLERGNGS